MFILRVSYLTCKQPFMLVFRIKGSFSKFGLLNGMILIFTEMQGREKDLKYCHRGQ